jgi:hypothetical protein
LIACKNGEKVIFLRDSENYICGKLMNMIIRLLSHGYLPDDIFILGASMKKNIKKIENELVRKNIPCYVPSFESDKIDDRVIKGKVVFSTFHSVKGRQRKFVIVTEFDSNYFEYYAKNMEKTKCPNTIYVGCTRATDQMILVECDNSKPLNCLKQSHKSMREKDYIDFRGSIYMENTYGQSSMKKEESPIITHKVNPTDMIKFVSEQILDDLSIIVDDIFVQLSKPGKEIEIPIVTQNGNGFFEDVSALNGIAIPCLYTDQLLNTDILYSFVENELFNYPHKYIKSCFDQIDKDSRTIGDYLLLTNILLALKEGLHFRLKQIDIYDWLDEEQMEECFSRLDSTIRRNETEIPQIEVAIVKGLSDSDNNDKLNAVLSPYFPGRRFIFTAIVDMICDDIWELKCTSSLTMEYFLQLAIYTWIWRIIHPEQHKECKLFNFRTGELYWLKKSSIEDITPIVVKLLEAKYTKIERLSDEEFINQNSEII